MRGAAKKTDTISMHMACISVDQPVFSGFFVTTTSLSEINILLRLIELFQLIRPANEDKLYSTDLQPNSERFQQGSKTVPFFWGACIFVTPVPGPRDWNPADSLLGNRMENKAATHANTSLRTTDCNSLAGLILKKPSDDRNQIILAQSWDCNE